MNNLSANTSLPGSHQDLFSPADEDCISGDLEENDEAATATTSSYTPPEWSNVSPDQVIARLRFIKQ
jgi:hypothetical protein